ncbi:MAG: very short patch repair endonuclease [Actinomycetales bacterium]
MERLGRFQGGVPSFDPMVGRSNRRPEASSERVSVFMSSQRTENTGPERRLRSALHRRGVRFRLHRRDLPGRPDLVLPRLRVAVFVDGCFWHACPEHMVQPKSNAAWWSEKLAANTARDRMHDAKLIEIGWEPVHVWEHDDPEVAAEHLAARWHARTPVVQPRQIH